MIRMLTLGFGLLLAASLPALSDDAEMDRDLMQSIDDSTKSVTSYIDLHNAQAALQEANDLEGMLRQVEAFYQARQGAAGADNVGDAVRFSHTSRELADRMLQQVRAQDFSGASEAAAALSRSCRACHDVYKPLS